MRHLEEIALRLAIMAALAWLAMLLVGTLHHATGGTIPALPYWQIYLASLAWAAVVELVRWTTRDRRRAEL